VGIFRREPPPELIRADARGDDAEDAAAARARLLAQAERNNTGRAGKLGGKVGGER
jgi:hypothetical protein